MTAYTATGNNTKLKPGATLSTGDTFSNGGFSNVGLDLSVDTTGYLINYTSNSGVGSGSVIGPNIFWSGFSSLKGTSGGDTIVVNSTSGTDTAYVYASLGTDTYLVKAIGGTLDLSDATNNASLTLNSVAGTFTGSGDLPGGHFSISVSGGISHAFTTYVGSSFTDTFQIGNVAVESGDTFNGGAGLDTLQLLDAKAGWTLTDIGGGVSTLAKGAVSFTVSGFEHFSFADSATNPVHNDVNGDGFGDMLFINTTITSGTGYVWDWELGTGTSVTSQGLLGTYSTSAQTYLASADASGDGKTDLFFVETGTGKVIFWQNSGGVTDIGYTGAIVGTSALVGTGDSNNDGKVDLFFQDASTGAVSISTSGFSGGHVTGTALTAITGISGLDSSWSVKGVATNTGGVDGGVEMALYQSSSQTISFYKVVGTTATLDYSQSLDTSATANPNVHWAFTNFADLNGDGKQDAIFRATAGSQQNGGADISGLVYTWLFSADGHSVVGQGSTGNPDYSWSIKEITDLNKDGKDDIVWQHAGDGALYHWDMNGTAIDTQGGAAFGVLGGGWQILA